MSLLRRRCQGLLHVDVLPAGERLGRALGVQGRRQADDHRVDVGPVQHLAPVAVARGSRRQAARKLEQVGVGLGERDKLGPVQARQDVEVEQPRDATAAQEPDPHRGGLLGMWLRDCSPGHPGCPNGR